MDLRHLRYFVTIAEERSFTRAAERLWVAQPGLSAQIRRLEAELGVQLFTRHVRGVSLTDAGELFLERARATLAAAESAAAIGRELSEGITGSLRLGISAEAAWPGAPQLLATVVRELPGIELSTVEAYGGALWRELRNGRLDAVLAPAGLCSGDLRAVTLGTEPWTVLLAAEHPLADGDPLTPERFSGSRVAVHGHRDAVVFDGAVADLVETMGVDARLVACGPPPALRAAVAAGSALGFTSAADPPPGMVGRRLQPERSLSFALLARRDEASSALAELTRIALDLAASRQPAAGQRPLAAVA
ncbi:MAG TPA: LysR family transcriptional regulator [Solirubrobacteraceae bacterium]|nr:LysR family transcriptional regulator [Solirubrobacteraceae bacterium]